ncbi:hypothetical protein, partial [Campylobacter coli]|uniref:hypothetical protein n=1 Tax=Campylobacter coli TaxID=195 RepID=UPI0025AFAA33
KAEDIVGELYGDSIPVMEKSGREYHFYLFFQKEFLQTIDNVLVRVEKFKEDDCCDLSKECDNQIIGYSKNLLNDAKVDDDYKLGIPEYLGRV